MCDLYTPDRITVCSSTFKHSLVTSADTHCGGGGGDGGGGRGGGRICFCLQSLVGLCLFALFLFKMLLLVCRIEKDLCDFGNFATTMRKKSNPRREKVLATRPLDDIACYLEYVYDRSDVITVPTWGCLGREWGAGGGGGGGGGEVGVVVPER